MKVVCGLGNPGSAYEATRHNVGWWVLDHLRERWRFPPFRKEGAAAVSVGQVGEQEVRLLKPVTYMNRSGAALRPLLGREDFDAANDLLVVVDDVALPVGRVRCRARGSAGGHNGLKSIEATLRSQEYARLRIGVGAPPPGWDLSDWVLSPFEDRREVEEIIALFPMLAEAIEGWIEEGVEAAVARCSRGAS